MTFAVATDLPANIDREYDKTKGKLFFQRGAGFLGRLLAQVDFRWTRDIPTACISQKMLCWNPDFFESLDEQTRITVLAHELWHNALAHGLRLGDRCPDVWNIAGDHVINLLLEEHGYYMDGLPYIMDPKYKGWATEDVYDDLGTPSGGGKVGFPNEDAKGQKDLSGDVVYSEGKEEIAEGMGKVISAFAASKITCKPGDVPGEIEEVVDKFLNPKLPWNTILFNYFNAMVEDSYSYARPNRRYDDPMLPGMVGREGLEHLVFAADVSGSVTNQQILRFFSEGKFIHEELRPEAMTLVTFDTKVHDIFRLEREDPYETFVIHGRGGTDLKDLYEFAGKENATALVVFTDLYVDIPPNPDIPIIWIVVDNPSAKVPYGTLIHLSE